MELAERAVRPPASESRSQADEVGNEAGVVPEVRQQRSHGALAVLPERARLTRAELGAPSRVVELAEAWFHGSRIACGRSAAIRVGAAWAYGLLPSRNPVALQPLELDVDLQRARGQPLGRRLG